MEALSYAGSHHWGRDFELSVTAMDALLAQLMLDAPDDDPCYSQIEEALSENSGQALIGSSVEDDHCYGEDIRKRLASDGFWLPRRKVPIDRTCYCHVD